MKASKAGFMEQAGGERVGQQYAARRAAAVGDMQEQTLAAIKEVVAEQKRTNEHLAWLCAAVHRRQSVQS